MLDGIKNGNSAKPAVKIAPTTAKLEPKKLKPALFLPAANATIKPPKIPAIGAIMVVGKSVVVHPAMVGIGQHFFRQWVANTVGIKWVTKV